MNGTRSHTITDAHLTALTGEAGTVSTVRELVRAQRSKQLLLVWGVMAQAQRRRHPQAQRARDAYGLLTALQERHADAVEAVLTHPSSRAWAVHTLRGLRGGPHREGAEPGTLAALAAAALVRSRATGTIETPVHSGAVTLPGVGRAMVGSAAKNALLRSTPDGAHVTGAGAGVTVPAGPGTDAPGWQGLRVLSATARGVQVRFLLDDVDPYRMPGAPLAGRLPAAEVRSWRSSLAQAWDLLVRRHPGTAAEIRAVTTVLTPLAYTPAHGRVHGLQSASSKETFGCTALSAPTDARVLAVTLAHEAQHAKLTALMDLLPLTLPDDGRRYYAPWRDDPRPIDGLLHGAYAHLRVCGFWRVQRWHENGTAAVQAHVEFARWREAALEVVLILLGSGRLTPAGTTFVTGMADTLGAWSAEAVPLQAVQRARREAEWHRHLWGARNQPSRVEA